jgi:hypothetical protein
VRASATVVGATRYVVLLTQASCWPPQANEQASSRMYIHYTNHTNTTPVCHGARAFCAFLHALVR